MLTDALRYQSRGWSVIPLRFTGGVDDRKRPLIDSWEQYQKKPADAEQIKSWWTQWPNANIGIVMGEVSGLIAIDLDGPHSVECLRRAKVDVPKTASVSTGKGFHAYYAHPGYPVSNRARLLTDNNGSAVDVRGDGGYVVAPPSVHGSGRVYSWVIPPEAGIAKLPPDLAMLLIGRSKPEVDHGDASWLDEAMKGSPKGARNDTCARLAGYWLNLVPRADCLRILTLWADRCDPPFPAHEVKSTVDSVSRIDTARKAAEQRSPLSRLSVVEAQPWLEEIERDEGRKGTHLQVPGFPSLGGLVPGDMVTLAGRPGMGKSTMACQVCVEAAIKQKVPTLVISTEMTRRQWGAWMAAYLTGSTTETLTKPLREEARNQWLASPIAITDTGGVSVKEIRALAETRLGLRLLVVDHIGRVTGGRKENRVIEVGDVARGLKSIAKDLNCTVLSLCQMNRRIEGSEDKQPRLDDLRESGELEQESDSVLFLWTDERDKTKAFLPMSITLAKNRHGPVAVTTITFDKARRRFLFDGEVPF